VLALRFLLLVVLGIVTPVAQSTYPPLLPVVKAVDAMTSIPPTGGEVHILIDTSGSMKKTDPKNLRIPSLKLLVNLLPAGSRAGVWLFDTAPVELMPAGMVDDVWKQQATSKAQSINSRGQFTDIEAAISSSGKAWMQTPEAPGHRHLILLTDGMVDVSKNRQESIASLQRIDKDLIPALQNAGVKVYTIALSKFADQDLMRDLAVKTGGWFEMADNAERLQRAFVALFNKTSRQDTVPLRDNRFNIDSSIEECTVLVMLRRNAPTTTLIAPGGETISLRHHLENVRWLHEPSFDLITIEHPEIGVWSLKGDSDPANQVMVVTHLKMEQAPVLDNFMAAGSVPDIAVRFTENGQDIHEERFLSLLNVHAELKKDNAATQLLELLQTNTGHFSAKINNEIAPGEYTLLIAGDGKTFQRNIEQKFNILENYLKIETRDIVDNGTPKLLVELIPEPGLKPDSLSISANLTVQTQQNMSLAVERTENKWQIRLHEPAPNDHWLINFNVKQKTPNGKENILPVKPLSIDGKPPADPPPLPPVDLTPEKSAPPQSSRNLTQGWQISSLLAIGINLCLAGIIWWGYKRYQRRQKAALEALIDRLK
jgi:hypothetical protein